MSSVASQDPHRQPKTTAEASSSAVLDPLRILPDNTVRDGDHFLLHFSDGRQIFGHSITGRKIKPVVKISKRSYTTYNLIGLPYGSVLEVGKNKLVPLPLGEGLMPANPLAGVGTQGDFGAEDENNKSGSSEVSNGMEGGALTQRDNRHIVDDNTSQGLHQDELRELVHSGTDGSKIVETIIKNSATFAQKTDFSRAKYVAKKQQKYQPRCRLVRCNGPTICEAFYLKDSRRIMNLREDTLGQILSYANVCAGSQVLVWETCYGIITGSLAHRMGGYGQILSVYSGQYHSFADTLDKFNLSFAENSSIQWVHSGDIPQDGTTTINEDDDEEDVEKADRDVVKWPCPLQSHTRKYLEGFRSPKDVEKFLAKRSARFCRKLTRHTPLEARNRMLSRQSDSLIIAVRYNPTETLFSLLPYLAPSCPFVVFCEFIEPLAECFLEIQRNSNLAINLRLSDTWAREYQVMPKRTHPQMTMSQSGGFILTGIKLDPVHGVNEMDLSLLKEIRQQIGGRRGNKRSRTPNPEEIAEPKKSK